VRPTAKPFKKNLLHRIVNPLLIGALRLGFGLPNLRVLVTKGRKSGKRYQTPVNLVLRDGQRYIVSPYGTEGWARNARAAGVVGLRRRGKDEDVTIEELAPEQAAPVLKQYLRENPITKPYFDADSSSPEDDFVAEAPGHPVFRVVASRPPG
jgi:deazaflavin-dependent oxidoreductase (nitroreductase family)